MSLQSRDCRFWLGDRPCQKSQSCDPKCSSYSPVKEIVLVVHLGALGAVLRSTSLLRPLMRKHPQALIYWLTDSPGQFLLRNSFIDRVFTTEFADVVQLEALHFGAIYTVDKCLKATSLSQKLKAASRFGFGANEMGRLICHTPAAEELFELGLDNERKFFVNQKPETQLLAEALELDYRRDPYVIEFSENESRLVSNRKLQFAKKKDQMILGLNTGCAQTLPAKKLSVEQHRKLIQACLQQGWENLTLLGGPEDEMRNKEIAEGLPVILSPTHLGLRDGLCSVAACDVVVTGDSLGMHMAIALKKPTIAWFGPTCHQEIDLFDRGLKVQTKAGCSPCWKRNCQKNPMCDELVDLNEIVQAISFWEARLQKSCDDHELIPLES